MIRHSDISDRDLRDRIRDLSVQFGGHSGLKIYGRLDCKSGRRMKRENRVFFESEDEAAGEGYRPCGNCMREAYKIWRALKQ